MAEYIYNTGSTQSTSVQLKRTKALPLDYSSIFNSLADAKKYINGSFIVHDERSLYGTSYVGQIISVYENGKVTTYKIIEGSEPGKKDLAPVTEVIDCGVF